MKNLELMGVQEMNAAEMRKENGGIIGIILAALVTYVVMEIVCNPVAHIEAFKEGWDAAKK